MKILLIGGSGQLGKSFQELAWDASTQLVAPSRGGLDITDALSIQECMNETNPDVVINTAAWTDVPGAEFEPDKARKLNSEAVRNLANACREIHATLVHISTDYVFDGEKGSPYLETDACNPINSYGATKRAGEVEIIDSSLEKYFIIRTSWLYSRHGKNFVKTIAKKALIGEKVTITNDQFGSPTYAGDLARAISRLVVNPPEFGIYNYSNSGVVSWFDFGKEIYELLDKNAELVQPRKTESSDLRRPNYSPLDLSKWETTGVSEVVVWKDSLSREIDSIVSEIRKES